MWTGENTKEYVGLYRVENTRKALKKVHKNKKTKKLSNVPNLKTANRISTLNVTQKPDQLKIIQKKLNCKRDYKMKVNV